MRWTIKRKLLALGGGTLLWLLVLLAVWAWWEFREHTELAEGELVLVSQQAAARLEALLDAEPFDLDRVAAAVAAATRPRSG